MRLASMAGAMAAATLSSFVSFAGPPARQGPGRRERGVIGLGSIAQRNRWTGQPHEHRREISRRIRQAAAQAGRSGG